MDGYIPYTGGFATLGKGGIPGITGGIVDILDRGHDWFDALTKFSILIQT
jgi:hypothetical protein